MYHCPNCKQPWQDARTNTCMYCGYILTAADKAASQVIPAQPQVVPSQPGAFPVAGAPVANAPVAVQRTSAAAAPFAAVPPPAYTAPAQAAPAVAPYQPGAAPAPGAYATGTLSAQVPHAPYQTGQMQSVQYTGQFPTQPPQTGQFPTQPPQTGQFPTQPPQTGQFSTQQPVAQPQQYAQAPVGQPAPMGFTGQMPPVQPSKTGTFRPVFSSDLSPETGELPVAAAPSAGGYPQQFAPATPASQAYVPQGQPPAGMFEQAGAAEYTAQMRNVQPVTESQSFMAAGSATGGLFGEEPPAQYTQQAAQPSLFGGDTGQDFVQTYKPAGGNAFGAPAPARQPSLFDGPAAEQNYGGLGSDLSRRSTAEKAARLQDFLDDDDDYSEYDDEPDYEDAPPPRRRPEPARPRRRADDYDDEYEDDYVDEYDDEQYGKPPKKSKGRGALIAVIVVVLIAIFGTLVYFVLSLLGIVGGDGASPSASGVSVSVGSVQQPVGAPSATPAPTPSSVPVVESQTPQQIAEAAGTDAAASAVSAFYQSYLASVNAQSLNSLQLATETCRTEVEARLQKPANQNTIFEFVSAAVDTQSVYYGENGGRPCIVINAQLNYKYRDREDENAAMQDGSNYQTFELVYENGQWLINRFAMINAADFEAHSRATLA